MKKNHSRHREVGSYILITNFFRKMKLTLFFVLLSIIQTFANSGYSQNTRFTLAKENTTIEDVLGILEKSSDFYFLYNGKLVDVTQKVTINVENELLEGTLNELFRNTNITYKIFERQVVLSPSAAVGSSQQQKKSISGKVTDSSGATLPGVSVVVKGTNNGVITDNGGGFSLVLGVNAKTLIFSFVGMKSQEITIGNNTAISVVMEEETIGIEEVVAVGYSTMKKANLTGAVENINSNKINWKPTGQTSMALQGIAPGVTITQNSGQPGKDGGTIRIRGIGTLGTAGQNPLILIDGTEGKIDNVDPNDIENISVLKDASSAAIYGSRAANGVIIITTKRGEKKKLSVSYDGYLGWQSPTDMPKLVSGLDHMLLLNEANKNMGQSQTFQDSYITAYRQNAPSDLYPDTDWQKLTLTNNGIMQNHSLVVSGGTDFIKLRGSIISLKQNGLIPNTGYDRNSIRLNTDIKISEKLNFKFDIRGSDELQYEPSTGVSDVFILMNGRVPANQEGVLLDGRYGQGWLGANSISYANSSGKSENHMYTYIFDLQGEWKPFDGMSIDLIYTPEFYSANYKNFQNTIKTYYGNGTLAYINPNMSSLLQSNNKSKKENIRAVVNYKKSIKNNNINILAGFEQIQYNDETFQARRENFPLENYQLLSLGSEINQKADGTAYEYSLRSLFGRVTYDFKGKYLLESNLRYDGSSRFADNHKYGLFPSFSAGWRISEENFIKNFDIINNLKLRASWGQLGNQNIGNYPFASSVDLTKGYILNEIAVPGASLTELGNPEISWETTEMLNVGLDLSFLKKLSVTADFYVKNTKDILLQLPIPKTVGLGSPYQNSGKVRNMGWDIGVSYMNSIRDFKYDVTLSLSDVKNEIIDLKGTGPYISRSTIRKEGEPIDAFYGYASDGLFQTAQGVKDHATQFGGIVGPGDIKYIDQMSLDSNGDGIVDKGDGAITPDKDRVIFGSSIPRYTYSLNLNASYKGFDLSMFFQGVGKADGYREQTGVWAFYVGSTAVERHLDRWTPENTDASYPRLTFNYPNNEQVSSYWLLNAAYLRLKNLQIGYTLPKKIVQHTFIDFCRIYFSGQNIFTVDKFLDGFDVEAPNGSAGFYPMVKTFTFGINVKF